MPGNQARETGWWDYGFSKERSWSLSRKAIEDKVIRADMPEIIRIFVHLITRACVAPELKLFSWIGKGSLGVFSVDMHIGGEWKNSL